MDENARKSSLLTKALRVKAWRLRVAFAGPAEFKVDLKLAIIEDESRKFQTNYNYILLANSSWPIICFAARRSVCRSVCLSAANVGNR